MGEMCIGYMLYYFIYKEHEGLGSEWSMKERAK